MKTLQVLLAAVVMLSVVNTCLGNNCNQLSFQRVQCPGIDPDDVSQFKCKKAGCWWCDNGITPVCTEGYACRINTPRDCWKGIPGEENADDCRREYGCSWCEHAKEAKCREEFETDEQLTCSQPIDDIEKCEEGVTELLCKDAGCWWCPRVLGFLGVRCARGIACSKPGKVNCWPEEWDLEPNAPDCRNKLDCSWCPDSEVKCVREYMPPMPGVNQCDKPSSERTSCFVNGPNNCAKEGCWYCEVGKMPRCIRGKACDRTKKLDCWPTSNTDTPNKEDCRIKYGCSWCPTTEAGQPECLADLDECDRDMEDMETCLTKGQTMNRQTCLDTGCWWCPNAEPDKQCTRGKACEQHPKEDCWPADRKDPPNAEECRRDYKCAWCPDETPNCVKPQGICYYKEALSCFPFKDPNILKEDCLSDPDCYYCPLPSNRQSKCVRPMCRDGEILRFGGYGCCPEETNGIKVEETTRIVGGSDAPEKRWPWQGSFQVNGFHYCGSVLITPGYSLCAAHCANGVTPTTLNFLRYGFTDFANVGANIQSTTFQASGLTIHPDYNGFIGDPDIMVVQHDTTLILNDYVNVISLPRGEKPPPGMTCFLTGWGLDGDNLSPDILQEVAIDIVDPVTCDAAYGSINSGNRDEFTCFGKVEGGVGSCSGDSGGPGVCQRCKSCDWMLVGITAFGSIDCVSAPAQFPSVYTSVPFFENWVRTVIPGLPGDSPSFNCNFFPA